MVRCRNLKASDSGADGKGGGSKNSLKRESKKQSKQQAIDTGVIDAKQKEEKEQSDSFEKYYNKDLDLDEGKTMRKIIKSLPIEQLSLSFRPGASSDI